MTRPICIIYSVPHYGDSQESGYSVYFLLKVSGPERTAVGRAS